eukprot:g4634.t1
MENRKTGREREHVSPINTHKPVVPENGENQEMGLVKKAAFFAEKYATLHSILVEERREKQLREEQVKRIAMQLESMKLEAKNVAEADALLIYASVLKTVKEKACAILTADGKDVSIIEQLCELWKVKFLQLQIDDQKLAEQLGEFSSGQSRNVSNESHVQGSVQHVSRKRRRKETAFSRIMKVSFDEQGWNSSGKPPATLQEFRNLVSRAKEKRPNTDRGKNKTLNNLSDASAERNVENVTSSSVTAKYPLPLPLPLILPSPSSPTASTSNSVGNMHRVFNANEVIFPLAQQSLLEFCEVHSTIENETEQAQSSDLDDEIESIGSEYDNPDDTFMEEQENLWKESQKNRISCLISKLKAENEGTWKGSFAGGIMRINGVEYIFHKGKCFLSF